MYQTLYRMNKIYFYLYIFYCLINHLLFGFSTCQICLTHFKKKNHRFLKRTTKLYLSLRLALDFSLVVWNLQQLVLHSNSIFPIVLTTVIYHSGWEGLVFDIFNTDELGEILLNHKLLPELPFKMKLELSLVTPEMKEEVNKI